MTYSFGSSPCIGNARFISLTPASEKRIKEVILTSWGHSDGCQTICRRNVSGTHYVRCRSVLPFTLKSIFPTSTFVSSILPTLLVCFSLSAQVLSFFSALYSKARLSDGAGYARPVLSFRPGYCDVFSKMFVREIVQPTIQLQTSDCLPARNKTEQGCKVVSALRAWYEILKKTVALVMPRLCGRCSYCGKTHFSVVSY